jgi:hypothetical protein
MQKAILATLGMRLVVGQTVAKNGLEVGLFKFASSHGSLYIRAVMTSCGSVRLKPPPDHRRQQVCQHEVHFCINKEDDLCFTLSWNMTTIHKKVE